jgi:hypothetical protein
MNQSMKDTMNNDKLNFVFPSKARMFCFALMGVGLLSIILMRKAEHSCF